MAQRSFEDLTDEVTLRESALTGFFRWFGRLFVIGLLTLGAAYYLPLHRAHVALVRDHETLSQDRTRIERELEVTRASLASASATRDALEEKNRAAGERASRRAEQLAGARASLQGKLAALVQKGTITVSSHEDALVVAYAEELPKGTETAEPAWLASKLGLCTVVKAISEALRGAPITFVVGLGTGAEADSSRWEIPAVRAAKLAEVAEGPCKTPVEAARVGTKADSPGKLSIVATPAP